MLSDADGTVGRATWGLLGADKSAPPSLAMLKTLAIISSQAGLQPRNMSGAFKVLEEAGNSLRPNACSSMQSPNGDSTEY